MAQQKKKIFGKMLDIIGLEEEDLDEDLEERYDGYSLEEEEDEADYEPPVSQKRKRNSSRESHGRGSNMVDMSTQNSMKMLVYQPYSYDDTQNIIDNLRTRKPVIVDLENLDVDMAQRVLDFISGAVYALRGTIHKIARGIFVLAPSNVDISGSMSDEVRGNKNFFSMNNRE